MNSYNKISVVNSYNRKARRQLKKIIHAKDMASTNDVASRLYSQQKEKEALQSSSHLQNPSNLQFNQPSHLSQFTQSVAQLDNLQSLGEAEIDTIRLDKDCPYTEEEILEQIKDSDLASLISKK